MRIYGRLFLLLTLGVLPQGLFALDLADELESLNLLFSTDIMDSDTMDSDIQFGYSHSPTIPSLYRAQQVILKSKQEGVDFTLSKDIAQLDVLASEAQLYQRYPQWNFKMGIPIYQNHYIQLKYGLQYFSNIGHVFSFKFPHLKIQLESFWMKQQFYSRFQVANDSLNLNWAYEIYGLNASWQECFKWGCTSLRYIIKNAYPRTMRNTIHSSHKFFKNKLQWSWSYRDWKLQGDWRQNSHTIKMRGDEYDRDFLNTQVNFLHGQQLILWKYLGAQVAYWEVESPTPSPQWSIDPSNYPKEGLDSFWFIQSNEFLRWSFVGRMTWLGAIFQPHWSISGLNFSIPMKLGRVFYNIQELKETHSRWLLFVPLKENFVSQNTGNSYHDLLNLGIQADKKWNQWKLSLQISQLLPLGHSEGKLKVVEVVDQKTKTSNSDGLNTSELNGNQSDQTESEDYFQAFDRSLGDGLLVKLIMDYHF